MRAYWAVVGLMVFLAGCSGDTDGGEGNDTQTTPPADVTGSPAACSGEVRCEDGVLWQTPSDAIGSADDPCAESQSGTCPYGCAPAVAPWLPSMGGAPSDTLCSSAPGEDSDMAEPAADAAEPAADAAEPVADAAEPAADTAEPAADAAEPVADAPDGAPLANPACEMNSSAVSQQLKEITVNGVTRQFRLSVPSSGAGTPLAILMAFHGGGGRDYPYPQQDGIDAMGQSEGVITVYPLAELVWPNEGEWQLNTTASTMQDIDFVEAIIDSLSADYCVDQERIYALGYSLGGMFTYELACQLNSRFSAIVSSAGTMPVNPASCELTDNIAVLHIHGKADWLISYNDQWDWKEWDSVGTMQNIPELIEYWAAKNNCQTVDDSTSGAVQHIVHSDCDGGVRVEHLGIAGLEHDWPNTIGGESTPDVLWDFLSAFTTN